MYLIISNKQKSTSLVILLSQVCALYLRLWEYLGQECLPIIENIRVGEFVVLKKIDNHYNTRSLRFVTGCRSKS